MRRRARSRRNRRRSGASIRRGSVPARVRASRLHAGRARGVELFCDVGEEQDFARRHADRFGDALIRARVALRAGFGVEVAREERCQVARVGVAEQELLRGDRTRRIHVEPRAGLAPRAQARGHFRVHVRAIFAVRVAGFPDHALQRFQCRRLAIGVDPADQEADDLLARRRDESRFLRGFVKPVLCGRIVRMRFDERGRRSRA